MNDLQIEEMVAAGNHELSLRFDEVPRKEFAFVAKYLHSQNYEVRLELSRLLLHVNQPWALPHLAVLLEDGEGSVRALAAEAFRALRLKDAREQAYKAIVSLNARFSDYPERCMIAELILSLGEIGSKDDVERVLALSQGERHPILRETYQMALAKLGFKKSAREIELELIGSDGFGKDKALRKVEYIHHPDWIGRVKPLLQDEQIGRSAPMGPIHVTHRVCDLAVNVLRKIDPEKKIDFPENPLGVHYSGEEMGRARQVYGIVSGAR